MWIQLISYSLPLYVLLTFDDYLTSFRLDNLIYTWS